MIVILDLKFLVHGIDLLFESGYLACVLIVQSVFVECSLSTCFFSFVESISPLLLQTNHLGFHLINEVQQLRLELVIRLSHLTSFRWTIIGKSIVSRQWLAVYLLLTLWLLVKVFLQCDLALESACCWLTSFLDYLCSRLRRQEYKPETSLCLDSRGLYLCSVSILLSWHEALIQ